MSLQTNVKRLALASTLACIAAVNASPAQAGPLCDWLFGRRTVPQPYMAGYPYAQGYSYAVAQPYAAGYPLSTGYTTMFAAPATAYAAAYPAPVGSGVTGAAALQMPAYSSGYPYSAGYAPYGANTAPSTIATPPAIPAQGFGDQGYAMFSPPAGASFPVNPQPQTSFYGTGNVYPSYQAYQAPVNTNPSTIQTYPGAPASQPGVFGGMSRFFGNLFGTNYQTSYYRAPVTYYRPVTTVDATTGLTTIVQQPCSSYQDQIQRSPTTSFFGGTPVAAPAAPCNTATNYYNPYGGPVPTNGVAPASGFTPSTGFDGQNNPYYGPPATGTATGDNINLGQPSLDSSSRPIVIPQTRLELPPPPSTWTAPSGLRSEPADSKSFTGDAVARTAPNTRSKIRPLPAGEYPYPTENITTESYSMPMELPSSRPAAGYGDQEFRDGSGKQVEITADDRVASNDWGYKPIQWSVRQAAYETPVQRSAIAPPVNQRAQPKSNDYQGYETSGWSANPKR